MAAQVRATSRDSRVDARRRGDPPPPPIEDRPRILIYPSDSPRHVSSSFRSRVALDRPPSRTPPTPPHPLRDPSPPRPPSLTPFPAPATIPQTIATPKLAVRASAAPRRSAGATKKSAAKAPMRNVVVKGGGEYGASGDVLLHHHGEAGLVRSLDAVSAPSARTKRCSTVIASSSTLRGHHRGAPLRARHRRGLREHLRRRAAVRGRHRGPDHVGRVKSSAVVAWGASEEEPEVKPCNPNGEFTVCWDPLDGSSIVDNNWAVGTMIGIWSQGVRHRRGRSHRRHRPRPGHALIALYGPRTTVSSASTTACTSSPTGAPRRVPAPGRLLRAVDLLPQADQDQRRHAKIFSPANMRAGASRRVQEAAGLTTWTTVHASLLGRPRPGRVPAVHQEHGHLHQPDLGQVPGQAPPRVRGVARSVCSSSRRAARRPTASPAAPSWTCRSTPSTSAPRSASAPPTRSTASTRWCSASERYA